MIEDVLIASTINIHDENLFYLQLIRVSSKKVTDFKSLLVILSKILKKTEVFSTFGSASRPFEPSRRAFGFTKSPEPTQSPLSSTESLLSPPEVP